MAKKNHSTDDNWYVDSLRRSQHPIRRLSAKTNPKRRRVYRAYTEVQGVSGLDDVSITYSWKQNMKGSRKCGETYKVLVSNETTLSVAEIIEIYELRWQIELFFRELKSVLGFSRYRGTDFRSFERYIDVLLLSFLFLEWYRICRMNSETSRKKKGEIIRLRTHGLLVNLCYEINVENAEFLQQSLDNENRKRSLVEIIEGLLKAS